VDRRVVVVTGAAGGIGTALCQAFLDDACVVVGLDVSEEALRKLDELTVAQSNQLHAYPCDIRSADEVNRIFDKFVADLGRLDVLVNNAGIAPKRKGTRVPFNELTVESWDNTISVNLNGAFYCSAAAARHMTRAGAGVIVNITSLARGTWTGAASAAYIASKAGLDGLTRAMAMELLPYGIRVNAVAPGRVLTGLNSSMDQTVSDESMSMVPLKRGAQPKEIAQVVRFLASDDASYVVGETIDVSGGRGVCSAPGSLLQDPAAPGWAQLTYSVTQ
jgi:3-oxoacyl-[acyl-carrier protein] reductase